MNVSFLKNFDFSIYGESHGKSIGAIIDNLPSGFEINIEEINNVLSLRNPNTFYNTRRKDNDELIIESGIRDGKTTGTPLMFKLNNNDINSSKYNPFEFRLSHADFVSFLKYGENYPYQGGGPFSGRITAVIVVVGEICKQILKELNIEINIFSQISESYKFKTNSIISYTNEELLDYQDEIKISGVNKEDYILPVIDKNKRIELENILKEITKATDSVGAKLEFLVNGLPFGMGGLYFESFEGKLSQALFSIPGLKGINFGVGEDYAKKSGSELFESFEITNNEIKMNTNFSGGINGGLTNGIQDLVFSVFIKPPTPLGFPQDLLKIDQSGNLSKETKAIEGRHDRLIANKAIKIIDAWIYILLYDFILDNDVILENK